MGTQLRDVMRFLRTVRHLKPIQIGWRLRSRLANRFWEVWPSGLDAHLDKHAQGLLPVCWNSVRLHRFAELRRRLHGECRGRAEAAMENELMLSNSSFRFRDCLDWWRQDIYEDDRLAGFELHYQGYLVDLASAWQETGREAYREKWEDLVLSWIGSNPAGQPNFARFSWSPYVISERIRNWLACGALVRQCSTPEVRERIESSLCRQLAFLAGNLEHDLQANHLLQNLCGLAVGSAFMEGPEAERYRRRAFKGLARTVPEQVLADGMHEERSFLYHAKVLQDLLEVWFARGGDESGSISNDSTEALKSAIGRMAGLLESTVSELGELPLLNDSVGVPAKEVRMLIEGAGTVADLTAPTATDRLQGSGYLVRSVGPWSAVFDTGRAGPEHQMGHAHADHLTFELWYREDKLIGDAGTATYAPGENRAYYRGTSAHNTVRLDKEDSLELWGSFRVGRCPKKQANKIIRDEDGGVCWYGEHDGYRHLSGMPVHRRWFAMSRESAGFLDVVAGGGTHEIESFLHFHPVWILEECPIDGHLRSRLERKLDALRLPEMPVDRRFSVWRWHNAEGDQVYAPGYVVAFWEKGCKLRAGSEATAYAPGFSTERERPTLRMGGRTDIPLRFGWLVGEIT